jgi:hypothetical protein
MLKILFLFDKDLTIKCFSKGWGKTNYSESHQGFKQQMKKLSWWNLVFTCQKEDYLKSGPVSAITRTIMEFLNKKQVETY